MATVFLGKRVLASLSEGVYQDNTSSHHNRNFSDPQPITNAPEH